MAIKTKGLRYTNLPEYRESRPIRDLSWSQGIWFACWALPGLAFLLSRAAIPGFMFVGIGILGAWPFMWGSGLTYPRDWRQGWKIKRNEGHIYNKSAGGKLTNPVIDLELSQFWDILGTIYNPKTDADTIVVRTKGWIHANDGLIDRQNYEARVTAVLKTVISQTDTDLEFSMLNGQRPFDPSSWAADTEQNFLHADVLGQIDEVSARLFNNVNLAFNGAAMNGADPIGCFTITVKRPKEWRNIARKPEKFTQKQLINSPLMRVLSAMTTGLTTAGFRKVEILDIEELKKFVFKSHNVRYVRALLEGNPQSFTNETSPWPQEGINVQKNILITDDSFHRVLMVTGFGIRKILPGGLHRLYTGHLPWVVVSFCSYTVSKSIEQWILAKKRDLTVAWNKERYKGGMIVDRQERDKRAAAVDKVDRIYLSASKPIRFNVYLVISGTSIEEVDASEEALKAKLRELRIRTIPVKGRARILRAFLAATLGLRV